MFPDRQLGQQQVIAFAFLLLQDCSFEILALPAVLKPNELDVNLKSKEVRKFTGKKYVTSDANHSQNTTKTRIENYKIIFKKEA